MLKRTAGLCVAFSGVLFLGIPSMGSCTEARMVGASTTPHIVRTRATHALAGVVHRQEHCRNAEPFPAPSKLEACDDAAIAGALALLNKSRGDTFNSPFFYLMESAIFEFAKDPQTWDDVSSDNGSLVRSYSFSLLAERRAAVLLNIRDILPPLKQFHGSERSLFRPLGTGPVATRLARRWAHVRAADCAAYPVPECAAKLDDAMREMVDAVTEKEH